MHSTGKSLRPVIVSIPLLRITVLIIVSLILVVGILAVLIVTIIVLILALRMGRHDEVQMLLRDC